jgi:hypothetical protein
VSLAIARIGPQGNSDDSNHPTFQYRYILSNAV